MYVDTKYLLDEVYGMGGPAECRLASSMSCRRDGRLAPR